MAMWPFTSNRDRQIRPINIRQNPVDEWVPTTCGYCSTGCGIEVGVRKEGERGIQLRKPVAARGMPAHPVNQGKLCLKGIWEFEAITAHDRATHPLLRENRSDPFQRVSWDEALSWVAEQFQRVQSVYGRDALAVASTGQIYTEEFYALGKLVRGGLGTNNYDGNTTLCMASAVSGYKRAFGSDGPPGCYEDFEHTECLLAFGSNLVECHPVIHYRLKEALERRKFPVIVVDPRVTNFVSQADLHLPIRPGTDLVLLNALAHVILAEGLHDGAYIERCTAGFEEFCRMVAKFSPEFAEPITGIPAERIRQVARLFGRAKTAMCIWTMGINQSTHGTDGVNGITNLCLITGNIGKPGGTALSITGQCNAMGTREFSSCSGLPAYRQLENPEHRSEIARRWGVEEAFFPPKRGRQMTDIFPAIESGEIKALWLIATNPMTSMPNTHRVDAILSKLDCFVVQDVFYPHESAEHAHCVLPAAMWAEKTGTLTNSERRVGLVRKAVDPPGEARSDLEIFVALGDKLGLGRLFPSRTSEEVFAEMAQISHGRPCDYSGLTYELLEAYGGLQWPVTPDLVSRAASDQNVRPEMPRLYADGRFNTPDGKARLVALDFEDTNERPDANYPFWLNTGRVVEHWHTRTKTGRIGNLNKFSPIPYVEMHPADAEELWIRHLDHAMVYSRRGELKVLVQVSARVAPGSIFIPFHFARGANLLTLGLLDPISRQPAYKQTAVRITKVFEETDGG